MLRQLPVVEHPDLLVGPGAADDAAVYRLDPDTGLIQTVDFFPPIVDDPYAYGQVAVANALSDIYAMGGKPLLALNIVGFPADLPKELLVQILQGGADKAAEAGVLIVGGHTVDDKEPKYGCAVTGLVTPGREVTQAAALPGDALILTKPIGTGVITTAGKEQAVDASILDAAVVVMATLNREAAEAMMKVGVNACVDVTGFGLLGHLRAVVESSGVAVRIHADAVPLLDGARELVEKGFIPGGSLRNQEHVDEITEWHADVDGTTRLLLCDAQTSGGLLISVPAERESLLLAELASVGTPAAALVGRIVDGPPAGGGNRIQVVP